MLLNTRECFLNVTAFYIRKKLCKKYGSRKIEKVNLISVNKL